MNEIKNVLVLGVGAIGSIYATKLHDFNPDCVKVLLNNQRLARYKEKGIVFNGKKYDFSYITNDNNDYKADLIIIATKATDFDNASDMIKNFVGENTIILSLLNGISSEEILIKKYPSAKVLLSYFIGHSSMKSGINISFDGFGKIYFGEKENKEYSEAVLAVKNLFDKVGIDYEIPEDMLSSLWQKFIINIGINQTLAVVKLPYGGFRSEYVRNVALGLMEEAVEIARTIGIKNYDKFIDGTFKLIDSMPPELEPSMVQDINNGKLTEVDIFAGEVCRLGKLYDIETPRNEMAFNILKSVNEQILMRRK